MSRRFGRNQKRRLRAELASAKAETVAMAGVACENAAARNRALDRVADLERMLDDTARMVGSKAMAAGESTAFEADWLRTGKGHFRMTPQQMLPTAVSYGYQRETATMIQDEIMRLLEVESVREALSRMMHVRVTFDEIPMGYALSDSALREVPEDVLARRMAKELQPLLIDAIRELKGKR